MQAITIRPKCGVGVRPTAVRSVQAAQMVHLHRVNTDFQILGNHFGHILGFEAILNGIVDFYDIAQVAAPARGSADDKTGIKSGAHNY